MGSCMVASSKVDLCKPEGVVIIPYENIQARGVSWTYAF